MKWVRTMPSVGVGNSDIASALDHGADLDRAAHAGDRDPRREPDRRVEIRRVEDVVAVNSCGVFGAGAVADERLSVVHADGLSVAWGHELVAVEHAWQLADRLEFAGDLVLLTG